MSVVDKPGVARRAKIFDVDPFALWLKSFNTA